jgi:hypothetical protein
MATNPVLLARVLFDAFGKLRHPAAQLAENNQHYGLIAISPVGTAENSPGRSPG